MDDMKKCPHCGQTIKAAAKKCRFCGQWITDNQPQQPAQVGPSQQQIQQQRQAEAMRRQQQAEAQRRQQEALKAQQEAQQRAQQQAEAQRRAQQEAQQRAQQEAQQRAQQEAQQRAQQEAQRRAQQEAQAKQQAQAAAGAAGMGAGAAAAGIGAAAGEYTQRAQQRVNDFANSVGSSIGLNGNNGGKITVAGVLSEGFQIGLTNFVTIFVAVLLFILTCWIPYLNVGTLIALQTMPVELKKGGMRSPTFIFDGRYRKYMGEYFMLTGLMLITLLPAYLLGVVPGIIISIGWSLAYCLLIEHEVNPTEALTLSNKLTYGNKMTIFLSRLALGAAFFIVVFLLGLILAKVQVVYAILLIVFLALFMVVSIGVDTAIYKNLTE